MAVVSDYSALLSGFSWTSGPAGQAVDLSYSFSAAPTATVQGTSAAAAASFVPLSAQQKATVRAAVAQWEAASGVAFHEVSATPGDIVFGLYDLSLLGAAGSAGVGTYPSTGLFLDGTKARAYSNFLPEGGDVTLDAAYFRGGANGTDLLHVALHEIGHALGLKHPFDGSTTLAPSLDNGDQTVMSYSGTRAGVLGPLDIAAIQSLYGSKAGATHPFTSQWNAGNESLTLVAGAANQALFGSGGADTILLTAGSGAASGGEGDDLFVLDGSASEVNGGPGTDTVVTGLTYSPRLTVGGSGSYRYIQLPGSTTFETFSGVEFLAFTNGVYDLAADSFAATRPGAYRWTGAVDGTWANAANWRASGGADQANAPGSLDAVSLSGSVSGGGRAASLALSGSSALAGAFSASSLDLGSGRVALGDRAILASSGDARIGGGSVTLSATASVLEVGGGALQSGGVGTFQLDAGATLSGWGTINANAFNHFGTLVASGGTLRIIGESAQGTTGTARIAAGSTLWQQNLRGTYNFDGAGGTLRTDTAGGPNGTVPVVGGFAPGDAIVLSGVFDRVGFAGGRLSTPTAALNLVGDFSAFRFASVSNAAENTTTVTLVPDPDRLFDAAFYLARNPDVRAAGVDPWVHFHSLGFREGRDPALLFSTSFYLARNPDVAAAGIDPLRHYTSNGAAEGRNPAPFFDDRFYLTQNPDVKAAGVNPLLHFIASGSREGRAPSLLFSPAAYLAANPDVARAGVEPLAHYVANGAREGRTAPQWGGTATADPLIDPAFYDKQLGATILPTGDAAAQQAAWSFATTGWQSGLSPTRLFDTAWYLARNPDVAAAHVNPLLHYESSGWREGRDPSAAFSTGKYLAAYGDIRAAGVNPLLHYTVFGQGEGRQAFPA